MIKGITLIPDEIKREWLRKKVRKTLIAAATAYIILLGSVFFIQRGSLEAKGAEAIAVAAEKERVISKGSGYAELAMRLQQAKQSEAEIAKKLSVTAGLSRTAWSQVLKRLSHDVPQGVWLRGISTADLTGGGAKRVRVMGSATANKAIADFIFTLENSGFFSSVTLAYTQKRELQAGQAYDFELYMNINKTGETSYDW